MGMAKSTTDKSEQAWQRGNRDALNDMTHGLNHRSTWGPDWPHMNGAYRDGYKHRWAAGVPA